MQGWQQSCALAAVRSISVAHLIICALMSLTNHNLFDAVVSATVQPIDRQAEIMPSIARLHLSARKAVKHSKNDYARRMYSHVLTAWRNGTPTECAVAQVSPDTMPYDIMLIALLPFCTMHHHSQFTNTSAHSLLVLFAHQQHQTWLLLALLEQKVGEPARARAAFQEGIQLCPSCARLTQAYALFESKQGNMLTALTLARRAVALDPSLAPILRWKMFRDVEQLASA
jgi:tetratricopeptide (TPR) repeat protein